MSWEVIYLLCWIATAILSTMMVRFCIAIAPRLGYVDIPQHEAHKNHRKSTPVMGGAGMLFSWLIVLWAGCIAASRFLAMAKDDVNYLHDVAEVLKGMPSVSKNLTIIVGCAIFVTMLGMRDDRKYSVKALLGASPKRVLVDGDEIEFTTEDMWACFDMGTGTLARIEL